MTAYFVVAAFAVFSMAFRAWLGGLWRRWPAINRAWLKMLVMVTAVTALAKFAGHWGAGAAALTLPYWFFWRGMGHGALLRYPLGLDNDLIYRAVYKLLPLTYGERMATVEDRGPRSVVRWWIYALLRYGGAAVVVAGVVWFVKAGCVEWRALERFEVSGFSVGVAWNRAVAFPWIIVAAGPAVALAYWIAAHMSTADSWLLRKLGGVSILESNTKYHDPFLEIQQPEFAEHNEYPHHYAELVGGLVFGAAFAAAVLR